MTLILMTTLLFAFFAIYYVQKVAILPNDFKMPNKTIMYILIGVFIIKLPIAYFMQGYANDIALFKAWGELCNNVGFNNVYFQDEVYLDYPPAYLYVLAFLDNIKNWFNLGGNYNLTTMIVKMPAMLADMFIGFLIYKISSRRFCQRNSVILTILFSLNPLTILNSAVWGQVDSIMLLVLLYALFKLNQNKFISAGTLFGLGVLLKPQMIIFAPVFLFYTIFRKKFKGLILGLLSGILTMVILSIPFTQNFDFTWLIHRYQATMDYYNYYSVNAFNFHALIGGNWKALPEDALTSTLLSLGVPVIATALCGLYMFYKRDKTAVFVASAILMSVVFMFAVKMHERYLYPVVFLVFFVFLLSKDVRYFFSHIAFSTVNFLNVAVVLYLASDFTSQHNAYHIVISALNLLAFAYFLYITFFDMKPLKLDENTEITEEMKAKKIIPEKIVDRKFHVKDYILVGVVTVLYGVVAFWNLGSNKMVETTWTPDNGEEVIVRIYDDTEHFMYLGGLIGEDNRPVVGLDFTISFSDDAVNFENETSLSETYVYTWTEIDIGKRYKFMKIKANSSGNVLNEIAFRSISGDDLVPLMVVSGNGETLIDEQDIVPLYPSYMDSMYFDEIYHARTAYEHLLGLEPYENTHPPLGKYIISLFIMIFGMNPFGWRFAGALFGVLMLPVLYYIVKKLFGSSLLSACATMLFAFDFMHYAQTRIATIDTYAVFFILLMYAAMLNFIQKDITKSKILSLIIPLALSGIFMGIGISAKWTVAYGGLGLGVLFFYKLYTSYQSSLDKKATSIRCIDLCLYCFVLFGVIPFTIYFVAFLPITTLPHNIDNVFGHFINYQTHMFNYHSGVTDEHYFASPWYEWPFAIRNIWYYVSTDFAGTGQISTINSMGNPVLWGTSIIALLGLIVQFVRTRQKELAFILIGFLSVYMPWMLITRPTFVYHYFTAVPFIIMALIYWVSRLGECERFKNIFYSKGLVKINNARLILVLFVVLNLVLFLLFFPIISGFPTNSNYIGGLTWFPTWYLG